MYCMPWNPSLEPGLPKQITQMILHVRDGIVCNPTSDQPSFHWADSTFSDHGFGLVYSILLQELVGADDDSLQGFLNVAVPFLFQLDKEIILLGLVVLQRAFCSCLALLQTLCAATDPPEIVLPGYTSSWHLPRQYSIGQGRRTWSWTCMQSSSGQDMTQWYKRWFPPIVEFCGYCCGT